MLNMKKKRSYFLYKNGILSKYEMIISYRYMRRNTRRYLIFYISIFSIKYIFDALTEWTKSFPLIRLI